MRHVRPLLPEWIICVFMQRYSKSSHSYHDFVLLSLIRHRLRSSYRKHRYILFWVQMLWRDVSKCVSWLPNLPSHTCRAWCWEYHKGCLNTFVNLGTSPSESSWTTSTRLSAKIIVTMRGDHACILLRVYCCKSSHSLQCLTSILLHALYKCRAVGNWYFLDNWLLLVLKPFSSCCKFTHSVQHSQDSRTAKHPISGNMTFSSILHRLLCGCHRFLALCVWCSMMDRFTCW